MATKKEIIDYVMHTPRNSNSAVLGPMLEGYAAEQVAASQPTGTKSITDNGNYDVSAYQYASVNVPTGSSLQKMTIKNNSGSNIRVVLITGSDEYFAQKDMLVTNGSSVETYCLYTTDSRTDAFICSFFSATAITASTTHTGLTVNMVNIGTNLYALFSNASIATFFSGTPEITITGV